MIREGTCVSWAWGAGRGRGTVEEVYREPVVKTIDGNDIKRDASEDNPAYLIRQDDGQPVLKSASEVEREAG